MNTSLQFRVPVEDFEAHKTLAFESETSMSALLVQGIDALTQDPARLADVIKLFLEESAAENG